MNIEEKAQEYDQNKMQQVLNDAVAEAYNKGYKDGQLGIKRSKLGTNNLIRKKQKKLNAQIAFALDENQVVLEYGRFQLDKLNEEQQKSIFVRIFMIFMSSGVAIEILEIILSKFIRFDGSLIILLLFYLSIFIWFKKHPSQICIFEIEVHKKKKKLEENLKALNDYLVRLHLWLEEVSVDTQPTEIDIVKIDTEFKSKRDEIEHNVIPELSEIFGPLDMQMDAEARHIAAARLKRLKVHTFNE